MQQLSLKLPFMLSMLFFLGLASRDLNIHHNMLTLGSQAQPNKPVTLHLANLLYAEPTLKIKKVN
jgi:hypothetical protein